MAAQAQQWSGLCHPVCPTQHTVSLFCCCCCRSPACHQLAPTSPSPTMAAPATPLAPPGHRSPPTHLQPPGHTPPGHRPHPPTSKAYTTPKVPMTTRLCPGASAGNSSTAMPSTNMTSSCSRCAAAARRPSCLLPHSCRGSVVFSTCKLSVAQQAHQAQRAPVTQQVRTRWSASPSGYPEVQPQARSRLKLHSVSCKVLPEVSGQPARLAASLAGSCDCTGPGAQQGSCCQHPAHLLAACEPEDTEELLPRHLQGEERNEEDPKLIQLQVAAAACSDRGPC